MNRLLALLLVAGSLARAETQAPVIALVVGENEYRTWETLPEFAARELTPRGFSVTWVQASTHVTDMVFTNVEALARADLILVSARRRTPPARMMELLRAHLAAGKPLAGIRTANHAFALRKGSPAPGLADWPEFDREVFGADYLGHHGAGTTTVTAPAGARPHPILAGLPETFASTSTLYRFENPSPTLRVLLRGTREDPASDQPLAWVNQVGGSRIFYTSLGGPGDFANPEFRRLLRNGIDWCLDRPETP